MDNNKFTVDSNFFGDFKIGDNVVYNLKLIDSFYRSGPLIKPIVIFQASICEAIFYDFIFNKSCYSKEGIPGVRDKTREKLNQWLSKKKDRYEAVMDKIKGTAGVYKNLKYEDYENGHCCRKARNSVHIQASEKDEDKIFTETLLLKSELFTEKVLKNSQEYVRGSGNHVNKGRLVIPWKSQLSC